MDFAATIDPKSLGRIAVLMGGFSSERKVSLSSGSGVLKALQEAGCDAHKVDPAETDLMTLRGQYDRAVISLHGRFGEDGCVQGVLEYLQIPYTGAGVRASALTMDKDTTRRVWAQSGIPVAKGFVATSADQAQEILDTLGGDIVVKPSGEGSSVGVFKLKGATVDEVRQALTEALRFDAKVLVEERWFGRELTIAVLGGKALPIIEIKAPEGNYDYQNKYFGDVVKYECPAQLDADVTNKVLSACEAAFAAIGARGWGRIDAMMRDDGSFMTMVDIQGIEDFFGDMDFKVAGTKKGITAIQMDIKVDGLTGPIIKEAIEKTRKARYYILDKVMLKAIDKPREDVKDWAPKVITYKIHPDKIREVIGTGGKVIQKIVADTGAKIDIEDDGSVFISATEKSAADKALDIIKGIVFEPEVGAIYRGRVVKLMQFGAFVEFAPGKEGLVHISKLDTKRVEKVEDLLSEGDEIYVKFMEIDDKGRYNLSRKDALLDMQNGAAVN